MCGIVGYVGGRPALPILVDGLRRLEYRGYDSAGVAILDAGRVEVRRAVGKIAALETALGPAGVPGTLGIGHTRWATHGRPSEENAHPHRSGPFVVVHNGIIENHLALKKRLQGRGYAFSSETDTEVVAIQDVAWQPWLAGWVQPIQAALLIAGLAASIAAADAFLRKIHHGGAGIWGLAIQTVLLTAETALFLWLYLGASA